MFVAFEKTYLQELYDTGKTSEKKHRYQPDIVKRYKKCIDTLLGAKSTTHPGEVIKDEIEYRGIPQRKLAEQMGISPTLLNEILNAKRAVSTQYALLFEAAL